MKKIIVSVIILLLVTFFFPKMYISSPGNVTIEANEEFQKTAKKCIGFDRLTNAMEVAADAQGRSVCYGWLMSAW
jgi:hypothetical protein